VIQPALVHALALALAQTKPTDSLERSWSAETVEFMSNADLLHEASDGVRAFR
jgi:hypothetical protein